MAAATSNAAPQNHGAPTSGYAPRALTNANSKVKNGGPTTVAMLRMLPIAPCSSPCSEAETCRDIAD